VRSPITWMRDVDVYVMTRNAWGCEMSSTASIWTSYWWIQKWMGGRVPPSPPSAPL